MGGVGASLLGAWVMPVIAGDTGHALLTAHPTVPLFRGKRLPRSWPGEGGGQDERE
jgi:hypothetical protein